MPHSCVEDQRYSELLSAAPRRQHAKGMLSSCSMFFLGHDKWWHDPIQTVQIDVAVSFNELFCDGLMSVLGLEEERREPILPLKIDVTTSCNELLCHVLVPVEGSVVEGGVPIPVLEVNDELVVYWYS